ncbi:hypothetical protein [Gymnodinialimonas ulvae]|uniref:hypothetical protein n=1 Tax=Gymnodinialimonas ulvae TaxID=3126504 RepID=UPI0030EC0F71
MPNSRIWGAKALRHGHFRGDRGCNKLFFGRTALIAQPGVCQGEFNAGLQRRVFRLLNTWGIPMKKVLIAAVAVAAFATAANAGGIVVPQDVVIVDTAASNQGIFVPIFAVLLLLLLHHN